MKDINKKPNTSDVEGLKDDMKVQNILQNIAEKITVTESLPKNITEQLSFVCTTILKAAKNENNYLFSLSVSCQDQWLKIEQGLLTDFLIDIAIKLGVDENKLYRKGTITKFFNEFIFLSRSITNKMLRQGDPIQKEGEKINFNHALRPKGQPPVLSPEINPIELKYPIFAIGKNLYQEVSPGDLKIWSKSHAKDKYGLGVEKEFNHCVGFCNEPSHINYKGIIDDHYNKYHKIPHIPKKGCWKNTKQFLRHIFGEGEKFRIGLEYCSNLFLNPKQPLPALMLLSEKKNTGKSTFIAWNRKIYGKNVSVVNANAIKSQFTSSFANSLIVTSDEHAEGRDRIMIAQKLKMWITEEDILIEAKGIEAYTGKKFFKIIFAGNDEEYATFIEKENTRYWVLRIPQLKKDIFNFIGELEKEMPAFLYFLTKFKARPPRGRLYFAPEEFRTEAGQLVQENSRKTLHREIEAFMIENFESYDIDKVYFTPKHLIEDLEKRTGDLQYLRNTILKRDMKMNPLKNTRRKIGFREFEKAALDNQELEKTHNNNLATPLEPFSNYKKALSDVGMFYEFKREDFIEPDDSNIESDQITPMTNDAKEDLNSFF